MMSSRTLSSAMLVALAAISTRPARAAVVPPNDATVVALSVVPNRATNNRADVVIRVDGSVTLKHFTLTKPDKIVVDISGATLALPAGDSYDGVARGGITRIRYSQFMKSVVRVVLTLDAAHTYTVTQDAGQVRVAVDGAGEKFEPWQTGKADVAARPVLREPQAAPVVETKVVEKPRAAPAEPPSPAVAESPSRPVAESPALMPVALRKSEAPAKQALQSQEPRITGINWDKAPINDVIAMFASFTGRTILPSKAVTGTVTATITNLPWDVALREIMNANGYDVTINPDGVIVIDTFENIAARQATIPLQTRNIRLNYARAKPAADFTKERLTRSCPPSPANNAAQGGGITQPAAGQPTMQPVPQVGVVQSFACAPRGTVTADTITNSISITDVPSALNDLEAYARSLDLRQPQVSIKAKIVLVDRTTLEGLGLRYDLGTKQQFFNDIIPRLDSLGKPRTDAGQILLGGNTMSAIANATARIPGAALQLVYSTAMGNYDFTTFLEALQSNTLLDVQAEPQTSVLNNRTANLTAGTQVPIRVIDVSSGGSGTGNFPRSTVQMQQTGVILTVTPQITANRQIQMRVHVENSDVQFQASDVGAVFPTQKVDNEVLVADGETAVMGGLTQTTVSVSKTGLPILVDLPIIGHLFGVTQRSETKRDLLILITPHIIDDGQQEPPSSGRPPE
ncbi:MAG TPA: AMIN domain-containing protein [Gemmatimonadaceae bacterium]|jgi:type IV pilus assembly protein PilQ|nr:AMIN domain-containing protein [Gemmatimonadaceae bacterium]